MGAVYTIEEADKWLGVVSIGMKKAAMRGLLAAANRTVNHIVTGIIPALTRRPVNRGVYRAGWRAQPEPNGASVLNSVPHAVFIEHGVRPENVKIGRKMIEALTEWVRMKGIGGKVNQHGFLVKRPSMKQAEATAWAIAKSMKRRGIFGIVGLGVLKKAGRKIPTFIREEVAREIVREFQ